MRIDYRDEAGRKLTQKEAYRRISYAFHGRDPSKTTQEKRLRRMVKEEAIAKKGGAAVVNVAVATDRALAARGAAHITLQRERRQ